MDKKIDVGNDFSSIPAGRTNEDGPYSGEKFREDFLIPIMNDDNVDRIIIDFSNLYKPIGSSFLDEAFGYLIRKGIISYDNFNKKFLFIGNNKTILLDRIKNIIEDSNNILQGKNKEYLKYCGYSIADSYYSFEKEVEKSKE